MSLQEFIHMLSVRPLMYMREKKLEYLEYLLLGFSIARCHNGMGSDMDINFFSYFCSWLQNWIVEKVDEKYNRNTFYWYEMIYDISENEEKAFELFFILCRQFFKENYDAH